MYSEINLDSDNTESENLDSVNLVSGNLESVNLESGDLVSGNLESVNLESGDLVSGNLESGNIQFSNNDGIIYCMILTFLLLILIYFYNIIYNKMSIDSRP